MPRYRELKERATALLVFDPHTSEALRAAALRERKSVRLFCEDVIIAAVRAGEVRHAGAERNTRSAAAEE
jgi:hypothetical protein